VLWLAALLYTAYVVKNGGDFVHYRYLAFPVLVTVSSLGGVIENALGSPGRWRRWGAFAFGCASVVALFFSYPRAQLQQHPLRIPRSHDALQKYRYRLIEDAASHRARFDLAPGEWDWDVKAIRRALGDRGLAYHRAEEHGWCRGAYERLDTYVVQSFGLTDAVLTHLPTLTPTIHSGHRWELALLARDLVDMRANGIFVGEGIHRAAVERGLAAPWIARNIDAIEEIERRIYNRHDFAANLRLALNGWPKLVVTLDDVARAKGKAEH